MSDIKFKISELKSTRFQSMAAQIDSQSKGKRQDKQIDSKEIKIIGNILLEEIKNSLPIDKRKDVSEIEKELDDFSTIFNKLPRTYKNKIQKEEIKQIPRLIQMEMMQINQNK